MKLRWTAFLLAVCLLPFTSDDAKSLTININFLEEGEPSRFFGSTGGPEGNVRGGGSLEEIATRAAGLWEDLLTDPAGRTFEIDFGWRDWGERRWLAAATRPQNVTRNYGEVYFNNNARFNYPFYLDPTPDRNEEFTERFLEERDIRGTPIVTADIHRNGTGLAAGVFDVLDIAAHEIGHVLGVKNTLSSGEWRDVIIVKRGALAGTTLRTDDAQGSHLDNDAHPGAIMNTITGRGTRFFPTDIDAALLSQMNGFDSAQTLSVTAPDVQPIPLPMGVYLSLTGLGALIALSYRRRRGPAG